MVCETLLIQIRYSQTRLFQKPLWKATSISASHLRMKQGHWIYSFLPVILYCCRSANKHFTQFINCLSCTSHVPSKSPLRTASLVPRHPSAEDLSSPGDLSVATQLDVSLNWSFAEVTLRDFFSSQLYLKMKCKRYLCAPNTFENIIFLWGNGEAEMGKEDWERIGEEESLLWSEGWRERMWWTVQGWNG